MPLLGAIGPRELLAIQLTRLCRVGVKYLNSTRMHRLIDITTSIMKSIKVQTLGAILLKCCMYSVNRLV